MYNAIPTHRAAAPEFFGKTARTDIESHGTGHPTNHKPLWLQKTASQKITVRWEAGIHYKMGQGWNIRYHGFCTAMAISEAKLVGAVSARFTAHWFCVRILCIFVLLHRVVSVQGRIVNNNIKINIKTNIKIISKIISKINIRNWSVFKIKIILNY